MNWAKVLPSDEFWMELLLCVTIILVLGGGIAFGVMVN